MKRLFFAAVLAAAAVAAPAFAADVGLSISVGDPGFYGRIDIGDYPHPRLLYREPRVVGHVSAGRPPIYLYVPPDHAAHWSRYCREYDACGERVYFVDRNWYDREYVPRYRERHHDRRDERRDYREDRHDSRGDRRGDFRDEHRDHDRGRGR